MRVNLATLRILEATPGGGDRLTAGASLSTLFDFVSHKLADVDAKDVVYISSPRSTISVVAVIVCLQKGVPFTFCPGVNSRPLCATFEFDGRTSRRLADRTEDFPRGICYVITTSGTTGTRKEVYVPNFCIQANIDDFRNRFELTPEDTVLASTSFGFDPSIVELLIAFDVGCRLLLLPDEFRSKTHRLVDAVLTHKPTFIQMTPALFSMLPEEFVDLVLGEESFVKVLLLGGSVFPLELINKRRSLRNQTRIFDVYGVTEVSCWATVFEIRQKRNEVFLGESIRGTDVSISPQNVIILEGRRQCYVNGRLQESHFTGDRVEKCLGGWKIVGRLDCETKINGIRLNLEKISSACRSLPGIREAHFLKYKDAFLALFFVQDPTSPIEHPSLIKLLRALLPVGILPAAMYEMTALPLTVNGKVDENALRKTIALESRDREVFWRTLLKAAGVDLVSDELMSRTFVSLGLDSLCAAELAIKVDDPMAVAAILSAQTTVRSFVEQFDLLPDEYQKDDENFRTDLRSPIFSTEAETIDVVRRPTPSFAWTYRFDKCADGNPILFKVNGADCVLAASHCGRVICVRLDSGRLIWERKWDDRFEAGPVCAFDCVYTGSYQGVVRCLDVDDGQIIWQQRTNGESGERIHRLDVKGGSMAKPLVIESSCCIVFVGFLGTVFKFNFDLDIEWRAEDMGPVFAEPNLVGSSLLLVSAVGAVRLLSLNTGEETALTCLNEPTFCTPVIYDEETVVVATRSGSVHFLESTTLRKLRKVHFPDCAFVRSPMVCRRKMWLCATKGSLICADLDGRESYEFKISNNEVFSNPLFTTDDRIVVASRDNHLWCFRHSFLAESLS